MDSPVIEYSDARGHKFNETSNFWKTACQGLPCFSGLQWPDYRTIAFDDTIDGTPVVIQVWKGWCQKFLGLEQFPGGIGAEVGVYHRIPGRIRPTSFPFLPPQVTQPLLDLLSIIGDDDIWWPFPELNTSIEFTLTNPVTGNTFFSAGPEYTYWLNKWMDSDSYGNISASRGKDGLTFPLGFPATPGLRSLQLIICSILESMANSIRVGREDQKAKINVFLPHIWDKFFVFCWTHR
jgi:hypothetical protein